MLASLALIRARLPERGGWRTITLDSLRAGFRFVWGHAVIFPFLMMDFGANIFGTVRSLFPIYARDILAVGPQGLGIALCRQRRRRFARRHRLQSVGAGAPGRPLDSFRRDDLWRLSAVFRQVAHFLAVDRASDRRRHRRYDQRDPALDDQSAQHAR